MTQSLDKKKPNISVAAVVVTFNRKLLVAECIESLLRQSRPLERIVVIDNAGADGTQEYLNTKGLLSNGLVDYVRMEENVGGAGGFFAGMKLAFESGHDWIWVMDDDAEPLPSALERLLPWTGAKDVVAICPIVGDRDGEPDFSQPHRGWAESFQKENIVRAAKLADLNHCAALEITHSSFVGLMVSSAAIGKVGLPKREFFIHNDDTEFCVRLAKIGRILLVADSMILHKEAAKVGTMAVRQAFGRRVERVRFEQLWILYYGHRNLSWMLFRQQGSTENRLKFTWSHIKNLARVVVYDDHKLVRLRFWNEAFFDGIRGNFDNRKPKRLMGLK